LRNSYAACCVKYNELSAAGKPDNTELRAEADRSRN